MVDSVVQSHRPNVELIAAQALGTVIGIKLATPVVNQLNAYHAAAQATERTPTRREAEQPQASNRKAKQPTLFNQRYSKERLKAKALPDTEQGVITQSPDDNDVLLLSELGQELSPGKVHRGSSYSSTLDALLQGYHPQDFIGEAKDWVHSLLKPGWQFYPEVIQSISEIDLSHLGEDAVKLWHLGEQALQSSYATFTQGSNADKAYLLGRWAHTGTSLAANLLLFKGIGMVAESAAVGSMATRVGIVEATSFIGEETLRQRVLTNIAQTRLSSSKSAFKIHSYIEQAIFKLDVSTEIDTAVFWSGRGNRKLAESYAINVNKTTLELTSGGSYLDSLNLFKVYPYEQAVKPWEILSTKFAQQASGQVTAFVEGARSASIFNTIEHPILMSNPNVTQLVFSPEYKYQLKPKF